MKNQNGFTLLEILMVILAIVLVTGYVKNIIKLSDCDFKEPYKAEIIHGVGLIPPVGIITGWINVGI